MSKKGDIKMDTENIECWFRRHIEKHLLKIEEKLRDIEILINKKPRKPIISNLEICKKFIDENCVFEKNLFVTSKRLREASGISQKVMSAYMRSINKRPVRLSLNRIQTRAWIGLNLICDVNKSKGEDI